MSLIQQVFDVKGSVSIIDIGGSRYYWELLNRDFLTSRKVSVTIVNISETGESTSLFSFEKGDGCALRYSDESFDIAHSNSVIEHVGDWQKMQAFARETKRVGRAYYVQTPSYWFPIEPHFGFPAFHWLPRSIRVALLRNFSIGHFEVCGSEEEATELIDGARLLKFGQMRSLFDDALFVREKFGPLTKSFIAIRQGQIVP